MFWDCDVYWLPALAFLDPAGAKQIADERLAQVPGARANFDRWAREGCPVGEDKSMGSTGKGDGIMFAWETNHSGQELSTAPTRFEHHGPGSVLLGLDYARRAGLISSDQFRPVAQGVGWFYSARVEDRITSPNVLHTVSPDEWRTVDDDLYTNEISAWAMLSNGGGLMETPRRHRDLSGRLLQFAGDEGGPYQQVAGLLAAWPLEALSDQDAKGLYERVADRVSDDGPGMSYGIHTVVAARLGMTDEAYRQWSMGWRKFSDHPGFEFREHQKVPSGYFLTGAAAQINGVLYGFLGLRLDDHDPGQKPWKLRLNSGTWVSLAPSLPSQWDSVRCTLWFNGQPYEVYAEGRSVRVSLKRP